MPSLGQSSSALASEVFGDLLATRSLGTLAPSELNISLAQSTVTVDMTDGSTDGLRPAVSAASSCLRVETQFSHWQVLDEHQDLPPLSPLTPLGSEDGLEDPFNLLSVFREKRPSRVVKSLPNPKISPPATDPSQCTRCQMAGKKCIWVKGSCEGCTKLRKGCSHVGTPYRPRHRGTLQIRKVGPKMMKRPTRASKKHKVGGKMVNDPPPSSRWLRSSKRKPDKAAALPRRQLRPRPAPEAPVTPRRRSARVAAGRTGETGRAALRKSRRNINEHSVASASVLGAATNGLLTPKSIPRKRPRADVPSDGLLTPKSMPRKRRRLGTEAHEMDNSSINAVLSSEVGTDNIDRTPAPSAALPLSLDCNEDKDPHSPAQQSSAHRDIATPSGILVNDDSAAPLDGPCPPIFCVLSPPSSFSALSETPTRLAAMYPELGVANVSAPALPQRSASAAPPPAQQPTAMNTAPAAVQDDLAIDIADASPAGPCLPRARSPSLPARLASPPRTPIIDAEVDILGVTHVWSEPALLASVAKDSALPQPEYSESAATTPLAKSSAHPSSSTTARSAKRKLVDVEVVEDLPRLTRAQKRALMNKKEEKKQHFIIRIPPARLRETTSLTADRPTKSVVGAMHRDLPAPRKGRDGRRPSSARAGSTIEPGAEAVAVGHAMPRGPEAAAVDDGMPPGLAVDPTTPGKTSPSAKKRYWKVFEADCQITTTRRPLPPGIRPLLWAQTRQEVCETVPWFRTYQSGVSAKDAIPYGYLLANFASPRDVFEHGGRLIVSHVGGGQTTVEVEVGGAQAAPATQRPATAKKVVLQANQGETRSHQRVALATAWKNQHPVVLLADRGYALFPYEFDADEMYYALGWYWVRDMWEESEPDAKDEGHTRVKVCFQWVESQGRPWWSPREAVKAEGVEPSIQPHTQRRRPRKVFSTEIGQKKLSSDLGTVHCARCKKPSKKVYRLDWICLNAECGAFWTLPDGTSPRGEGFELDTEFLALAEAPAHVAACIWDYRPRVPAVSDEDGFTTSRAFQQGFFCKKCGRVSTRSKWECWQCPKCESRFEIEWPIHSSSAWRAVHGTRPWGEHKIHNPAVQLQQYTISLDDNGTMACINQFTLPNERGKIFQILGNETTNHVAEDILKNYQSDFVKRSIFKRVPLASHRLTSVMLTQYFSQNSGVPYKYVAGTDTTIPFSEAPPSVNMALELITRRARLVAPRASFNELLTAGYLEGQKMNFHSDFEQGLGDDVAALSLGSPAAMKFRANKKGGHKQQLEFMLNHGDILVMHGSGIQEHYEHTVVPTGFRIAATARLIDGRNIFETSATARKPMKLAPVQNVDTNASVDLSGMMLVEQAARNEGLSTDATTMEPTKNDLMPELAPVQNVESTSVDLSGMMMVEKAARNEAEGLSTHATSMEPWDKDWKHRVWMPDDRYNLDASERPW